MKCEDCHMRLVPFFVCKKYGWNLKEDKSFLVNGCNIDGELPPLIVPPKE